jgi:hypothetical protein
MRLWNHKKVQYLVGVDAIDIPSLVGKIPSRIEVVVSSGLRLGEVPFVPSNLDLFSTAISKTNQLASKAIGDWLMFIADDFFPPEHWWTMIESQLMCFNPQERIVFTLEGKHKGKINHPIMSRGFYEWQGYFWNPQYAHVYCDDDLYLVAKQINALKEVTYTVGEQFIHNHPAVTGQQWDSVHLIGNNRQLYDFGYSVLEQRKQVIATLK